ncbi:ATP-grasp domain-containing protein [Leptospira noguchii]|uniref:ATP-grasp domain-containing protein n=1 Tax=Leptospira noguchii TaxID=28182 RepID=UPI000774B2EA|nr:ATP-grasp domain-containing protein [Leptospira noguchii]UOG59331.1 ATP-grasp domain-containing protein [Leptospira noguchii]
MKTILITAIGSDIAQSIAIIIRKTFPDWKILGCDVNTRHGGSLVVDSFFIAPRADSGRLLDWLGSLIKEQNIDYCIPVSESELDFLCKSNVSTIGQTQLIMPNLQSIQVGLDKFVTNSFLKSIKIKVPWTIPSESSNAINSFPCIYKYRRGAGSKIVFECNSEEEAEFFRKKYVNGIFQELLLPKDREVTCSVYRNKDGQIRILQLLRELFGGFTGWAEVIYDPIVEEQCRILAEELELIGSINVQLRITEDGPRIFEINPRFSSTVLMRHLMGFRDVIWSIQDKMEIESDFILPKLGTIAVRIQGANLMIPRK